MIAALFVATGGAYFGLEGVDPWDEKRDARKYAGPWPVVAHPPCERWGNFWAGSPTVVARTGVKLKKGDDAGCFISALESVRSFGGVLEHPAGSAAWRHFGLIPPERWGAWTAADFKGGFTCCVDQGHYGHRASKATWLYAAGTTLPSVQWGKSSPPPMPRPRGGRKTAVELMGKAERRHTPPAFRDLLLSIARGAH